MKSACSSARNKSSSIRRRLIPRISAPNAPPDGMTSIAACGFATTWVSACMVPPLDVGPVALLTCAATHHSTVSARPHAWPCRWQRKTPPKRGPRFTTMVSVPNGHSARYVSRACLVAHPASTQSQRMGQLVESRQGLPGNPYLLCRDVGALSHGLPGEISCERFVNAALHYSAALASSVRNKRPDKAFFPRRYPLVREQTAHDQFPLDGLTYCVSACGAVAMELGARRIPPILRKGAAVPRCSQASKRRHQLGGGGSR